tara:strand:- start:253 stop:513 length:261 start_codon:yes stop_codon:yes gene_type:complete
MNINLLEKIIKEKIENNVEVDHLIVEDKSFLHKNHKSNIKGKYHIKIKIKSNYLKKMKRIDSNKKIYEIINEELKNYIHSIQIELL